VEAVALRVADRRPQSEARKATTTNAGPQGPAFLSCRVADSMSLSQTQCHRDVTSAIDLRLSARNEVGAVQIMCAV
jgi:hypothetical protein